MSKAPAVDRSTLRLSEVARHVVIPEGIVDTLWFEVEERCAEFGDTFDTWQDGLGQVTLGIREDGTWAATVGGVTFSIPRQVAKTFIVGRIVVALCTIFPNLTVLWTAHRTRTATNTFQKLKGYVTRPAVKGYLKAGGNSGTAIRDANGEQEIPFANGSRILFGAREAGFGRGFDEVDIIVFDEAQILTEKALEDMVAATNQSRWEFGALLFYMGTPPRPIDPGEVFTARRAEALALKGGAGDFSEPIAAGDAVYVECSADPDVGRPDGPSLDDMGQVEKANPSFPHRTPPIAVKRLRKNLSSDAGYRREGLGVWDDGPGASALIDSATWAKLAVSEPPHGSRRALGVRFSLDGSAVAVAGASMGAERVLVEGIQQDTTTAGLDGLVDWIVERWRRYGAIVIDGKAGAGTLVEALHKRGVSSRVAVTPTAAEFITAHSSFLDAVRSGRLAHTAQPGLTASVAAGGQKVSTRGWWWEPIAGGDVLLLEAATLALWGVDARAKPAAAAPKRIY